MRIFAVLGLALLSSLLSVQVNATDSVSVSSKSGRQESSVLDNLYLNYFAIYHGASMADPGAIVAADRTGAPGKLGINLDSELTGAYLLNSDIGVGAVLPFIAVPVAGQGLILGDVGLKAFDRKTLSSGGFNLYTNLIVQAPTSQGSQDRHMSFAVKTTPNVRYSFRGTHFSTGAWTEAKAYLGVTSGKTFKLFAAPYVNYSLAKNFSLNLEYAMEAHHYLGAPSVLDFTSYQTDLEPGVVWNITPRILVNPYLQIFTTRQVTADRTALGAVISATLL